MRCFPCAPWSAEAICKLYICVHKTSFTSSSVGKWHMGMILIANMMGGNLVVWILFEYCVILDGIFWIGVTQVGLLWVGIFWVGIFQVGVILRGNFPRWEFSEWELSGGNHPGGNFPSTEFIVFSLLHWKHMYIFVICTHICWYKFYVLDIYYSASYKLS